MLAPGTSTLDGYERRSSGGHAPSLPRRARSRRLRAAGVPDSEPFDSSSDRIERDRRARAREGVPRAPRLPRSPNAQPAPKVTASLVLPRSCGHPTRLAMREVFMAAKKQKRRAFAPEYKVEVVALFQRGDRTPGQVARDLELTETSVRAWARQAEVDAGKGGGAGALTTTEREQLAALRRENEICMTSTRARSRGPIMTGRARCTSASTSVRAAGTRTAGRVAPETGRPSAPSSSTQNATTSHRRRAVARALEGIRKSGKATSALTLTVTGRIALRTNSRSLGDP